MEGVVNKSQLVDIREGIEADHNFIYASWLRGLRHGNPHFELIHGESYFKHQHEVIKNILDDFEVTIKIACLKESPDVILGYCIYKNERLDWIFVKKSWRTIGLARDLVPSHINTVSHVTRVGLSLLKKHPEIQFNPYLT